ncbi:hypothetical protein ACVW1C_005941 [Bradyrhizobium sp. USDA 4011]
MDQIHHFFVQAAHIIFGDLVEPLQLHAAYFGRAHNTPARELGHVPLDDAPAWDGVYGELLTEVYDLWKDHDGTSDTFPKCASV